MNKPEPMSVYEWVDFSEYLRKNHPKLSWEKFWSGFEDDYRRGEIMSLHVFDIEVDGFGEIARVIKKEFEKDELLVIYDW